MVGLVEHCGGSFGSRLCVVAQAFSLGGLHSSVASLYLLAELLPWTTCRQGSAPR